MNRTLDAILDEQKKGGGALRDFPKSDSVRADFLRLAQEICRRSEEGGDELTPAQKQGLIVKFGKYCGKRQWDMRAVGYEISAIADAVAKTPVLLGDPSMTLGKMLRKLAAKKMEADDLPQPVIAVSDDGMYRLVECRTRKHLKEEGSALDNCLSGDQRADYLGKMARGSARIFSLHSLHGKPHALMEYSVRNRAIVQLESEGNEAPLADDIFLPALCQTLHKLSKLVPVDYIRCGYVYGLPQPATGMMYTKTGLLEPFDKNRADDMIIGTVRVDNRTPLALLHRYAASQRLTLDVTDLDLSRLPSRLQCNLFSESAEFIAPHIEQARDIAACNAKKVGLSGLVGAQDLNFDEAGSLALESLQYCGDLSAAAAKSVAARWLCTVSVLNVPGASVIDFPSLREGRKIHASVAKHIEFPQLESLVSLTALRASHIGLPKLRTVFDIHIPAAENLDISRLRTMHDLKAPSLREFRAPSLEEAKIIDCSSAHVLHLPVLRKVQQLMVLRAGHIDAPHLPQGKIRYRSFPNSSPA